MNRRTFLAWTSYATLIAAGGSRPVSYATPRAAADRAAQWAPSKRALLGMEWRYVAGRISDGAQDYGFIISVGNVRVQGTKELLVQRQDLSGAGGFVGASYTGTLTYDTPTATYTFRTADGAATATWQLDAAANVYRLAVATPELTLNDAVLAPQGALLAEGGDGAINVGTAQGLSVASDYYADWATVLVGNVAKGVARVDMQSLYVGSAASDAGRGMRDAGCTRDAGCNPPAGRPNQTAQPADYDHFWFAVAAEIAGAPVWISAWRIETGGPLWGLTIARGTGAAWQTSAYTEQSAVSAPLAVQTLAFQPLPAATVTPQLGGSTGVAWRIRAGLSAPDDLLDLTLSVPPGQFITSKRFVVLGGPQVMEEAVGTLATGTALGKPLQNVRLVVAETTTEFNLLALPLTTR